MFLKDGEKFWMSNLTGLNMNWVHKSVLQEDICGVHDCVKVSPREKHMILKATCQEINSKTRNLSLLTLPLQLIRVMIPMLPYPGFSKAKRSTRCFSQLRRYSCDPIMPHLPRALMYPVWTRGSYSFYSIKMLATVPSWHFDFHTVLCLIVFRFRLATPGLFPL